jgi:hypothetical protein
VLQIKYFGQYIHLTIDPEHQHDHPDGITRNELILATPTMLLQPKDSLKITPTKSSMEMRMMT